MTMRRRWAALATAGVLGLVPAACGDDDADEDIDLDVPDDGDDVDAPDVDVDTDDETDDETDVTVETGETEPGDTAG
jgi:hypothetical protein